MDDDDEKLKNAVMQMLLFELSLVSLFGLRYVETEILDDDISIVYTFENLPYKKQFTIILN